MRTWLIQFGSGYVSLNWFLQFANEIHGAGTNASRVPTNRQHKTQMWIRIRNHIRNLFHQFLTPRSDWKSCNIRKPNLVEFVSSHTQQRHVFVQNQSTRDFTHFGPIVVVFFVSQFFILLSLWFFSTRRYSTVLWNMLSTNQSSIGFENL